MKLTDAHICSHCGFPLPENSAGLRHYGTHTAHQESECLRLLHAEIERLRAAANALLHQIDIGDFVDSHGHSAKMLKATNDLMALLTPNASLSGRGDQDGSE